MRPPVSATALLFLTTALNAQQAVGIFEGQNDVGTVLTPGTARFDAAKQSYALTGSGDNMWAAADAFHYVWKRVSGDVALAADVAITTASGDAHRKGVLMFRQSLDGDSAYCDAALHGDGLTSLQCRESKGAQTFEIQQAIKGPVHLRIEKRGQYFYVFAGRTGEDPHFTGGAIRIALQEPFYAGIGVCAHNQDAVVGVRFSNVRLAPPEPASTTYSTLEVAPLRGDRRAAYVGSGGMEAASWTPDGALLFTAAGKVQRVPLAGGMAEQTAPAASSGRARVVAEGKSGKRDIYLLPAGGGKKTRLTKGKGSNDHPELSPDGKYVYFSSTRGGKAQIWRMQAEGSTPEQITSDEFHSDYPHVSPDGSRLAVLSAEKPIGAGRQDVMLRLVTLADKRVTVRAKVTGGEGTLNAPCWSPDGQRLAFISYQTLPAK